MSEKLPFGGSVEGVRLHLKRLTLGEAKSVPGQLLTSDQAEALLAMTDDLRIRDSLKQGASTWLAEHSLDGLLPALPSGKTLEHETSPFFVIRSFKVNGNSSDQDSYADARQRRFEQCSSDVPEISAVKPVALTYEPTLVDLAQILPLLKRSDYWTATVRMFLGVESAPLTVAVPPASTHCFNDYTGADVLTLADLLKALVGSGHIKKGGVVIKEPKKLPENNSDLRKSAGRGESKQGSSSKFSYSDFKSWLIAHGYVIRYAPTAPTSAPHPPHPLLSALGPKVSAAV